MANIYWQSPAANSTIVTQGNSQINMEFYAGSAVGVGRYEKIAGAVPPGTVIDLDGTTGSGLRAVTLQGQLSNVSDPTLHRIVLRAWDFDNNNYVDSTFNFLVNPTPPHWITEQTTLANILTGNSQANSTSNTAVSIDYTEPSANANVEITILRGQLPPGLTIDEANVGGIRGNVPVSTVPVEGVPYYKYDYANVDGLDFNANSFVKTWDFTLNISDDYFDVEANYAVNIYAREFLNASANFTLGTLGSLDTSRVAVLTADMDRSTQANIPTPGGYANGYPYSQFTFPTDFNFDASATSRYGPWIVLDSGLLGNSVSYNYFARPIPAMNYEPGATVRYILADENPDGTLSLLPLGTKLDPYTGYVYGRPIVSEDSTFVFTVSVTDDDLPDYQSRGITYSMNVTVGAAAGIEWQVPSFLGEIDNGTVSELYVAAISPDDPDLYYEHTSGNLPPGLKLTETGFISGRVCFDIPGPSQEYVFYITARGVHRKIDIEQRFSVRVRYANPVPYNDLYLQAYPEKNSKFLIENILQDYVTIPPDRVYRLGDVNFGYNNRCRFLQAWNINVSTDERFQQAMSQNHYRRRLKLAEFKYAVARDSAGQVVYEVIYSPIVDDLVDRLTKESVPSSVKWPFAIPDTVDDIVHPNSLDNMRDRIYQIIGQVKPDLPRWMVSVQPDRQVLGYIPAWVIAYVKPGFGREIAFQMNQRWARLLPTIDFDIDRYVLNDVATYRYDPVANSWQPPQPVGATVLYRSGNILVSEINAYSSLHEIKPGDSVSWNSSGNLAQISTVLVNNPWTPFVGNRMGANDNPADVTAQSTNFSLTIDDPGWGYTAARPPTVTISDPILPGGRRARANASVGADGRISAVTLTSTGSGYYTVPTVTIGPPFDGNVANTARAHGNIWTSPLITLRVAASGDGYESTDKVNPRAQFPAYNPLTPDVQPADAAAEISIVGTLTPTRGIQDINVNIVDRGQNYQTAPYIAVDPPFPVGNRANIISTIYYQTLVGNAASWDANISTGSGEIYLVNKYTNTDELNKYYLFPHVGIIP